MNREEIVIFTRATKAQDALVKVLAEHKMQEFTNHQIQVCREINDMLNTYFPPEVVELIKEYISDQSRILTADVDYLWIDIYGDTVRIRLDPNRFKEITFLKRESDFDFSAFVEPDKPDIKAFKRCVEAFKDYELLRKILAESIDEIYNKLSAWKTEKLNSELEFLNGIQFEDKAVPKKLKVTLIVKEV